MKISEKQLKTVVKKIINESWYSGPPDSYYDPPDYPDEYPYECECQGGGEVPRGERVVMKYCDACYGVGYPNESNKVQAQALAKALGVNITDPEIVEKFGCKECMGTGYSGPCPDHPECAGCGRQIVPGKEDQHKSCDY